MKFNKKQTDYLDAVVKKSKTRMSVIAEREEFIEQEADYESEDQTDSPYYQSQEDYYNL